MTKLLSRDMSQQHTDTWSDRLSKAKELVGHSSKIADFLAQIMKASDRTNKLLYDSISRQIDSCVALAKEVSRIQTRQVDEIDKYINDAKCHFCSKSALESLRAEMEKLQTVNVVEPRQLALNAFIDQVVTFTSYAKTIATDYIVGAASRDVTSTHNQIIAYQFEEAHLYLSRVALFLANEPPLGPESEEMMLLKVSFVSNTFNMYMSTLNNIIKCAYEVFPRLNKTSELTD